METTAGMTREATSANEGIVTAVTGPDDVWIGVTDWACDFCIIPRSALISTPNATEATMIAAVDKVRLFEWFMVVNTPPGGHWKKLGKSRRVTSVMAPMLEFSASCTQSARGRGRP